MSDFDNDYWNSFDSPARKLGLGIKDIGIGHGMGDVFEGLKSKIQAGAKTVELGFMGIGKGNRGKDPTPETFGKEERKEMRQLATINEVEVTTHASANIMGFAGMGDRGFDKNKSENAIHEIKKAVDFAVDVTEGGPVVVHTSEFPIRAGEHKGFESYKGESGEKINYIVDRKSGQFIKDVREDEVIWRPKPKEINGKIQYIRDIDGKIRIDPSTGEKMVLYDIDKEGNISVEKTTFSEFKKNFLNENPQIKNGEEAAAVKFYEMMRKSEIENQLGHAEEYEIHYKEAVKDNKDVREALKFYKNLEPNLSEKGKEKVKEELGRRYHYLVPEKVDPVSYLNEKLRETEKRISYAQEVAISSRKNAAKIKDELSNIGGLKTEGLKRSAENLARVAMYAYEKEQQKGLKKSLFIAPENIWSELGYGAHPKEIREIINASRKELQKELERKKGMSSSVAKKVAEDHIKATFDIGHANTWRKFFKRKEGESLEDQDKRFDKWLLKEVDGLVKDGIIGHVHLSDNFGYNDEHLTPGQGNAPIEAFVKRLTDRGYKGKIIAEGGGSKDFLDVLTGSWSHLSTSPLYRNKSWSDIGGSYFGSTGSTNFIVGDYAPSKDWSVWSETPLE